MRNGIERRCYAAAVLAIVGAAARVGFGDPLPAFPGADGFGADALGGRGGFVYHVTDLTDSASSPAPGSFRYGLNPRNWPAGATAETIVFDVGGTIPLADNLSIKGVSNVTIAGQTAPGPGITLMNYKLQVTSSNGTAATDSTSNIVVRYLSSYRGGATGADDAVGVLGSSTSPVANTHDIILDHLTAAWGNDENLSVTNDASNVTIMNSFITEPVESGHQYGSLIRPTIGANVSYIGNLYANSKSRNPRPGSYNGATLNFDFRNNVIYNYSARAGYTGGSGTTVEAVNMNYVGNYVIAGPVTPTGSAARTAFTVDESGDGVNFKAYQSGNKIDPNGAGQTSSSQLTGTQGVNSVRDGTDTGWGMFAEVDASGHTVALDPSMEQSTPFNFPTAVTYDADTAYARTLAQAGNTPWARSAPDARVVNDVKTSAGSVLTAPPAAEWNALASQAPVSRAGGFDSDSDGMPDAWEKARGLNPGVADNNAVVTAAESPAMAGYTWLEMYLNDLTMQAAWAGGTNGSWDAILNWSGKTPNLQDSTAAFQNIGAAGTVSVGSNEHVGQLSLDNPSGYTFSGGGSITMDVMSRAGGTGGYATVQVLSGSHVIGVPLNLMSDTHFTVTSGGVLDMAGGVNAAGRMVQKDGFGLARFTNLRAAGLNLLQGKLEIAAHGDPSDPAGVSVLQSLAITSGASLDLTNNTLILQPTSLTKAAALQTLKSEVAQGAVISSQQPAGTQLAILDNGDFATPYVSYAGQMVDANSLIVTSLLPGDADGNGTVDGTDLAIVLNHFGERTDSWAKGDFAGDATIDLSDVSAVENHMGLSIGSGANPSAAVAAPEPGSCALLAFGAAMLIRRRRWEWVR